MDGVTFAEACVADYAFEEDDLFAEVAEDLNGVPRPWPADVPPARIVRTGVPLTPGNPRIRGVKSRPYSPSTWGQVSFAEPATAASLRSIARRAGGPGSSSRAA